MRYNVDGANHVGKRAYVIAHMWSNSPYNRQAKRDKRIEGTNARSRCLTLTKDSLSEGATGSIHGGLSANDSPTSTNIRCARKSSRKHSALNSRTMYGQFEMDTSKQRSLNERFFCAIDDYLVVK